MPSIEVRATPEEVQKYFQPTCDGKKTLGRLDFLLARGYPIDASIEIIEYTVKDGCPIWRSEGPLLRITHKDIRPRITHEDIRLPEEGL